MIIDEDYFNSYDEFLNALKPNGKLNKVISIYVFRGQAEDWPLIPTSLRLENKEILSKYTVEQFKQNKDFAFRYAEYYLLREFYKNANSSGIKLPASPFPEYDYIMEHNPANFILTANKKWLPKELAEVAALAQHYGVMTRLLDWSFDINVALYFAAEGAVNQAVKTNIIKGDNLIIWMLASANLESIYSLNKPKAPPIRFVIPSYYDNPNICAQKGVLTYWETPMETKENFWQTDVSVEPLDKLLNDFDYLGYGDKQAVMYKLHIPSSESLTILKHLSSNNYNAATIFPGYYGAAKKIEEDRMILEAEKIFNQELTLQK